MSAEAAHAPITRRTLFRLLPAAALAPAITAAPAFEAMSIADLAAAYDAYTARMAELSDTMEELQALQSAAASAMARRKPDAGAPSEAWEWARVVINDLIGNDQRAIAALAAQATLTT